MQAEANEKPEVQIDTVAEYARALIEQSNWHVSDALDLLKDRSIKAVADGNAIGPAWRRSLTVAIEIERLVKEHEVQETKRRWEADLKARFAELMQR